MTANQLPKSPWMYHPKTRSFSIEMSEVQGYGLLQAGLITGPTGSKVDFKNHFLPFKDSDGDVQYWEAKFKDFTYTVFND